MDWNLLLTATKPSNNPSFHIVIWYIKIKPLLIATLTMCKAAPFDSKNISKNVKVLCKLQNNILKPFQLWAIKLVYLLNATNLLP